MIQGIWQVLRGRRKAGRFLKGSKSDDKNRISARFYHLDDRHVYLQASPPIIKQMCWLWNDEKIGGLEGWKRFLFRQVNRMRLWNLVYPVPNEYFSPLSFLL
jgi:hypothetical protein